MEPLRRDYVDSFHGRKCESAKSQMLCFHCEEYISRSAQVCPYCKTNVGHEQSSDLEAYQTTSATKKITPLNPLASDGFFNLEREQKEESSTDSSSSPYLYISTLFLFLIGSTFFFLGVVFPLLSEDGKITLSWDEALAIPLLVIGMALLCIGYYFLKKIDAPFIE